MDIHTFDFNEAVLLDDVGHLFLLLLALVRIFLQLGDLAIDVVKTAAVGRTVRDGPQERRIGIFEWLWTAVSRCRRG